MSRISSELGVQSYCFRGFKEASGVIGAQAGCGVDRLEMCGVHLEVSGPDTAAELAGYTGAGVKITAFGGHGIHADDEAGARAAFEFANLAGFPALRVDIMPGALELTERLCEEYGKTAAVHNHGRRHRLGSVAALEDLFAAASANVGLCLDTAWMLDSGENPLDVAEKFKDRLYGLHVKDFVFDRAG